MKSRKELIEEACYDTCCFEDIHSLVRQKGDYLIFSYWDGGSYGGMGSLKDVKDTIKDMMTRKTDHYDLDVINIKTGRRVTWKTKIEIAIKE